MSRPPFKEAESARDDFAAESYKVTKTPNPDWRVGQGGNDTSSHPRSKDFSASKKKEVYSAADLNAGENYKMIVSGVIPRPIAFVSSQDAKGNRNLAPYSYFGAASHNPPTIMISMNAKDEGSKDTTANILETKKFTVNLISETFIEAANWTCVDAPHGVSEWELSGLTPVKSKYWGNDGPPLVGESAFSLECEYHDSLPMKNDEGATTGHVVIGRIRNYVLNEGIRQPNGDISPDALLPVGRGGGITYLRVNRGFELPRPLWKEEQDSEQVKTALQASKSS
ncbi:hypothetical protein CBS101457_006295 [Exobasidium rhododendri]|nr:hypothetical protein CBS101457_006295 [Exobasidium rhododendri]